MSTVIPLSVAAGSRRPRPRLHADDRLNLARTADNLLAAGRDELAAYVIELLYRLLDAAATEAVVIGFPRGHGRLKGDDAAS